uniref:Nucleotide-diphospho-sugar transferase domain-containing protein n=1 Tax=Magnetococcus massalia (strain MO-1) TaxID=451514 RepID=A0A1S7LPK0_MAGMO|nr:Protein of unknown function. putative nucleotide-diphospho-sugar transferases [Candidatus Magnetococcus massalia]
MNATAGVIYCAAGEKYIQEAIRSAHTLKQKSPGISVSLFTDQSAAYIEPFDHILPLPEPRYSLIDRFYALRHTPYEKSLCLDCDTLVLQPIDSLFEILNRVPITATHAPLRHQHFPHLQHPDVPDSFPLLNVGVLGFARSEAMDRLLEDWYRRYCAHLAIDPTSCDQPSFRESLWFSELSYHVLPPEYNFRLPYWALKGMNCKVVIAHSHNFSKMTPQQLRDFAEIMDDDAALFWNPFKEQVIRGRRGYAQRWR